MSSLLSAAPAVLAAYLVGSIPFGLLVARVFHGIDIRQVGSGNIGATNVGRNCGSRWGLLVLLLDACKGAVSVWLLSRAPELWSNWNATEGSVHLAVVCGLAAIAGHMYPVWLKFQGGKGVATGLGAALVLAPVAAAWSFFAFVGVFAGRRIVSLASLVASCTFAGVELWLLRPEPFSRHSWSLAVFSLAAPVLIVVRHRENMVRLLRGDEQQFRSGTAAESEDVDGPAGGGVDPADLPERGEADSGAEAESPRGATGD